MPSVSEHKLKTVYGIPAVILLHVLCPERKGPYIRCTKLPDSSPLRNAPERHGPNARHRTFRGTWRSCEVKLGRLLGMLCAQVCPGWVNYPKPGQEIGGLPGSTRIYQDLTGSNKQQELGGHRSDSDCAFHRNHSRKLQTQRLGGDQPALAVGWPATHFADVTWFSSRTIPALGG